MAVVGLGFGLCRPDAIAQTAFQGDDELRLLYATLQKAAVGEQLAQEPAKPAAETSVTPPVSPVEAGKTAAASCVGCHGETGVSAIAGTPNLAGEEPGYLVAAMKDYKSGQRKNDTMNAMVASLDEATMNRIAQFYALQKPARAQTPAEGDAEAGKAAAASCAGCHGDQGISTNPATPNLAGQDSKYLVDALQSYKNGTYSNTMMAGVASTLDEATMKNLAAFYAGLEPQPVNVSGQPSAPGAQGPNLSKATCLGCHGQPDFSTTLANGQTRSLFVSADHFADSVHGSFQCTTCHTNVTEIPHKVAPLPEAQAQYRQEAPRICGSCHTAELGAYSKSIHGDLVLSGTDVNAAVCTDCHTTHAVGAPTATTTELAIVQECGTCHQDRLQTYLRTVHGQVASLGYAFAAKCYDCHGYHGIQRVSDPASPVYPANRLATCRKCHQKATAGFITFDPHATPKNFARDPYTWLASKFMLLLLAGTFAFFWTHCALWLYRELRDRHTGAQRTHIRTGGVLQEEPGVYYARWPAMWRLAHLTFAASTIVLLLTGMTLFYAGSFWAPAVSHALGGPRVTGLIHRVFAVAFISVFLAHLVYVTARIIQHRRTFKWFGPTSLVANPHDFVDIYLMFRWFVGAGPKPLFDKWTYWEKFDYWAPWWGVIIIGVSGAMMWFHDVTASILPGWIFNVTTIVHGEEALLAAGFLFTVHFFNNHWRPEQFPLDIRIFTGVMPIEQFRREHTLEYNRLVKSGRLADYTVQAPSRPMAVGSAILGFFLTGVGLIFLIFILAAFAQSIAQ